MYQSGIGYKSTSKPHKLYSKKKKKKIHEYIIDETIIKVGFEYLCLWIKIEPKDKEKLSSFRISKERNMFAVVV